MMRDQEPLAFIGRRLGVYEVLGLLGAGGMGEVYRARDTKLGRDVAIKILPRAFTSDPDRVTRFEREARLLASLNHPHIGAIYGFEDAGGVPALVLELIEGVTLADRLRRGALPIAEALAVARQIADALDAAHERGIVHRDLKPANVKVTADGVVKVLDFGLAKALAPDPASVAGEDLSASPTMTLGDTQEGAIFGTPAYMSPEQARGKAVDKRTDIWSFGCVLYELLTGRHAFPGETASDIVAAILGRQPDWSVLPAATPETVRRLLDRCLDKDPKRRLRDIGDARAEIEDAVTSTTELATPIPGSDRGTGRTRLSRSRSVFRWIAAGMLGVAVGGLGVWSAWRRAPAMAPPVRFAIHAEGLFSGPVGWVLALAPDGQALVYVGRGEAGNQLFRRSMDRLEAVPIPGTEGALNPFFSPDGRWVGFSADGAIKKVALAGGSPVRVAELTDARFADAINGSADATWGADDTIVWGSSRSELMQVAAAGGRPRQLTTLDDEAGETNHWGAEWLPGAKALLFTANRIGANERERQIALYTPETGKHRVLLEGLHPLYSPSGHIVFGRAGSSTVWAVPFDLARLELVGPPVPVLDGVRLSAWNASQIDIGADGSLAYVPGAAEPLEGRLVWREREGRSEPAMPQLLGGVQTYRLSPDGRRLAVTLGHAGQDQVWVYDLGGQRQPVKLTTSGSQFQLCWTPDGERVAFGARAAGPLNLSWIAADGSSLAPKRLIESALDQTPWSFSPDAGWLLFAERHPESGEDLWLLPLEGSREPQVWLRTEHNEAAAAFSPDGRWVAYVSDQYGEAEVFVRPFAEAGAPMPVSRGGGHSPLWARDQSELYFLSGENLMAVGLTPAGDRLSLALPETVFSGDFVSSTGRASDLIYDVAPDGRFLMIQRSEERETSEIVIVKNWSEELRRLAPRAR
ncbi:MAG TPA: protein kinase [Thermoanaerobaculia bacterium]|nr:protein kinase [Thermoanaerobaculia bacterium]